MGNSGQRFKTSRENANLTQGQAAKYSGTVQTYISDLERGRRWPSTWTLLENLADLYGVSVDFLIGRNVNEAAPDIAIARERAIEYRSAPVEPLILDMLREMPVGEQIELLESLELYRRMSPEQRAAVDRIMRQFVELNTPRIIGGLPDPDE